MLAFVPCLYFNESNCFLRIPISSEVYKELVFASSVSLCADEVHSFCPLLLQRWLRVPVVEKLIPYCCLHRKCCMVLMCKTQMKQKVAHRASIISSSCWEPVCLTRSELACLPLLTLQLNSRVSPG